MALNRSNWLPIQQIVYKQKANEMFQSKTVKIPISSHGFVQLPGTFLAANLIACAQNILNYLEPENLHFLFSLTRNHLYEQPKVNAPDRKLWLLQRVI